LLSPENVRLLCREKISLSDYQKLGGVYIRKTELDMSLTLEPFPQLRFLSRLLNEETKLMDRFIHTSLFTLTD